MNKPSEFSDVLNWEQVLAPGVIGCKDGSFLAGWQVRGLDTESMEPEVLDAALARLSRGFGGFREDSAFWVIFNRRETGALETDTTRTQPAALELLEEETRLILSADAALFRNDIHIVCQFKPADPFLAAAESLAMFDAHCRLVEGRLGSVLSLTRLSGPSEQDLDNRILHFDALAGLLAGLLSGRQRRLRVPEHKQGVYLDLVLGVDFQQSALNDLCHIDGRAAAIISLDGFPIEFGRATLQALETLDFEYQWVTRYAPLSPGQARSEVARLRRFWRQRGTDITAQLAQGGGGERDAHADLMAQEADAVMIDLGRGDTGYGHFASTLILFAAPGAPPSSTDPQENPTGDTAGFEALAEQVETVTTCFLDAGFEARLERQGALETYLGSLPGHAHRNPREVLMSSSNLVELMPLRTAWKGEVVNPSPLFPAGSPPLLLARAQTGELFHFNLHHGDVGHTLIFGPTSAGKSVLLGLMAAQFLKYNGAQVVFFDKRRSSQHATCALGGCFTAFGAVAQNADGSANTPTGIAPMAHLTELGRDWGIDWVCELARQSEVELTPARRAEIRAAIENALKTGASTAQTCADTNARMSLAEVRGYVQDPELRSAICAIEGEDGSGILNQDHGDLSWADLTVFETHDLFEQSEAVAVLALDYIFAELELRFDGRPTLLILDEAWSFLRHGVFVERIRSWLKEARKSNVAVVLATQSISDVTGSDITPVLLESCKTKIFLPNPAAKTDAARNQYRALGVNETQIDLISAMTPKQDYYLVKPDGQRVVDFLLGPVALSILGNTSTAASKRAAELYAKNPGFWKDDVARVITQNYMAPKIT